jgi:hypothetical protein
MSESPIPEKPESRRTPRARLPNRTRAAPPRFRIMRDPDGGWFVIAPNGHGWLFGSKAEALLEKRQLERNERNPSND